MRDVEPLGGAPGIVGAIARDCDDLVVCRQGAQRRNMGEGCPTLVRMHAENPNSYPLRLHGFDVLSAGVVPARGRNKSVCCAPRSRRVLTRGCHVASSGQPWQSVAAGRTSEACNG